MHPIKDLEHRGNRQQAKRNLAETAIGRGIDIDVDPCDSAWGGDQNNCHYRHISHAEGDRDKAGATRRFRRAGTEGDRDTDRSRLSDSERHHENDADTVHHQLVGAERVGPEQAHQDPGCGEHADLQAQDPSDRQTETQDTPDLVPMARKRPHSIFG